MTSYLIAIALMAKILRRRKGIAIDCVALVKGALDDTNKGLVQDASNKLYRLKENSVHLTAEARQLVRKLEKAEAHYMSKEETLMKEIGSLGCKERDLKGKKKREQENLNAKQEVLQDNESKLRDVESQVRDAEQKLREAREKEGVTLLTGVLVGGLLSVFTFGLGLPVGLGIAAIVNACNDDVDKSRKRLQRVMSYCQQADAEVRESKRRFTDLQYEMNSLERKIRELRSQQQTYQEKKVKIKHRIIFCKKAINFWELFKQASEHGTNRTSLLQNIVDKASERGDYRALYSRGSKRIATTFLEAWENIETMAIEGQASYLEFN